MRTDQLDYSLPPELIALEPAPRRQDARLLVVHRHSPRLRTHTRVERLPDFLRPGDAIVINDTRVLRARLNARRTDTGGRVEGLFLSECTKKPHHWRAMLKASNRLRPDLILRITAQTHGPPLELQLVEKHPDGTWTLRVIGTDPLPAAESLERLGAVPLPPYILHARKLQGRPVEHPDDADRYQTVYADTANTGSVAAPTAGLHFTPDLLEEAQRRGDYLSRLTLHVGAGTFKPVETDSLDDHPMHAEYAAVPAQTLDAIRRARHDGARCLAVGTTTARALESVPAEHTQSWAEETNILIAPGYRWKRTDALLTNFHLPRSTLLAMVAALFPAGITDLLNIYNEAIEERYRFYSFGDAMLILP